MTTITNAIDIDGHVYETEEMWDQYVEAGFHDRRPIFVKDHWGKLRWMIDGNVMSRGRGSWNPDSFPVAGCKRPGGYDPVQRLPDMDLEGIDVSVLYPSLGLAFAGLHDAPFAAALCRAMNNWLADYCSEDPRRIRGVATLPLQDLPVAEEELKRCVETLGFRTLLVQTNVHLRNVDDHAYDRLYHYCQDSGISVGFHPGFGAGSAGAGVERFVNRYVIAHAVGFTFEGMLSAAVVVMNGLLERFPTLRCAVLEAGTGWIPYWMERLDEHFEKRRDELPDITMKPSEYFKHPNLFFSCESDEEMLPYTLAVIGDDRLVMASDYPHWDAPFPDSVTGITKRTDLSDEQKRKILIDNAKVYLGENGA